MFLFLNGFQSDCVLSCRRLHRFWKSCGESRSSWKVSRSKRSSSLDLILKLRRAADEHVLSLSRVSLSHQRRHGSSRKPGSQPQSFFRRAPQFQSDASRRRSHTEQPADVQEHRPREFTDLNLTPSSWPSMFWSIFAHFYSSKHTWMVISVACGFEKLQSLALNVNTPLLIMCCLWWLLYGYNDYLKSLLDRVFLC